MKVMVWVADGVWEAAVDEAEVEPEPKAEAEKGEKGPPGDG